MGPTFWTYASPALISAATVLLVVLPILRPFIEAWLKSKIEAGVQEQTERRMRVLQLDLDKDLERHRGTLAVQMEMLRGDLARTGIDYGLYAQRRHDAIARLYEAFLAAETLATNFRDIGYPASGKLSEAQLNALINQYFDSSDEAAVSEARRLWVAQLHEEVHKLMRAAARDQIQERVFRAYSDAQNAYFAAAIYLPDGVNRAAVEVRDHYNAVALPYLIDEEASSGEILAAKTRLRFLMLEFQNAARAELSRSAVPG